MAMRVNADVHVLGKVEVDDETIIKMPGQIAVGDQRAVNGGTVFGATSDLQSRISTAQGSIDNLFENLEEMQSDISGNINDIQGTINDIQGTINDIQGTINDIQGRIDGVYTSIDSVQDTINDVQGTIDDVEDTVLDVQNAESAHEHNYENPHNVTKVQVGLGNCDNTRDVDKPISTATQAALDLIDGSIDAINAKIPLAASISNQLADKAYVSDAISTSTANFLGTYKALEDAEHPAISLGFTQAQVDLMTDPYGSESTLAGALANKISNPLPNDYVFVEMDFTIPTTSPDEYRRFKWDGTTWAYEYTLNNSSFTADQWAAINSLITAALVTSYNAHLASRANPHVVTKAQVGLGNCDNTSDSNKPVSTATQAALDLKVDKVSGKGLSTNDFTDTLKSKLDSLNITVSASTPTGGSNGDIWIQY